MKRLYLLIHTMTLVLKKHTFFYCTNSIPIDVTCCQNTGTSAHSVSWAVVVMLSALSVVLDVVLLIMEIPVLRPAAMFVFWSSV